MVFLQVGARRDKRLVAYYRVSTDRQGQSGLGLEAQQQAVHTYLHGGTGHLVAEYTEVESGKGSAERPALQQAIAAAKRHKATLIIAKLDRLARNVYFIAGLMESGVDFVAVDMPHANRLTIHICSGLQTKELRLANKGCFGLALIANKKAVRPTLIANESTIIAKGLQTARQTHIHCE